MSRATKRHGPSAIDPVRVLGRGLRASRGVHLPLRTLREAAGKTQADVALASQIDQSDVSRLEARSDFDDVQMSTLRRYLHAIGGEVELVGVFGNKRIVLIGVEGPANTRSSGRRVRKRGGR